MNSWIIENMGWTLLHSLWQISFVAAVLFCVLRIFRDFSANLRYLISVSALCLSFILPLVTFVYLSDGTKPIQTTKQTVPIASKQVQLRENKEPIISETVVVPPIVSADNPSSSSSPNILFMPIIVGFWLIGVLFFSIRLLGGIWTVHLYKTRETSEVETFWKEKFNELFERLNLRQKVRFLQSKKVEMPMVIGWLKPVVLVPASAFLQISPKELETILIHELIHIKRRDYLVNFLQSLIEILFFYHPCVWWISAKIKNEREFAVDEFISQTFENERFIYANALATLEEIRTTLTPNLAMAADGGNLMKRIENILIGNRKLNSKNISIWSAVFAVTFVLGISVGIYGLKNTEVKKTPNGGKIAIIISSFSEKIDEKKSLEKMLEVQEKYKIPATWVLDSKLIDAVKEKQIPVDFFSQTSKNNSDFIIEVPNFSATIYINGDDEYVREWIKRIGFVEENLAKTDYKLKYYSMGYSSQIPQEMENFLTSRGLKLKGFQSFDSGLEFNLFYERDCTKSETGLFSCKPTSPEKQKEIREKFLQYMSELIDLNANYYQTKYGKEITQTIRLAKSKLTDDTSDELFQMLKDKGYEFVPYNEAVAEEVKTLSRDAVKDKDLVSERFKLLKKYWQYNLVFPQNKVPMDDKKVDFKTDVSVKSLQIKEN